MSHRSGKSLAAACLCVFVCLLPSRARAQATGAITGMATDSSGGVLPGVTVDVTSRDTGQIRSAVTGADGFYTVPLVNPGLYQTLPYDPVKDFTAICELAVSPHVFAVKPDLGVATMKEFVGVAKASPEKFNVSTPPIGTTPQLQAEVLKLREGLQGMATIVFPGGGDALKALIGGTVQLSSGVLAPAHPHIKAGTIKALAVTGRTRWHDLPEIPTMLESGYPDFVFETYTALMAPAKTPAEVVALLEQVALDILRRPDMRDKLTESGFEVTAKPGTEHKARVASEVPMFRDIIAQAGIKKL